MRSMVEGQVPRREHPALPLPLHRLRRSPSPFRGGFLLQCIALAAMFLLPLPAQAQKTEPRLRGLFVGIAVYDDPDIAKSPLVGARNDAIVMAEMLQRRGAKPADIMLLIGDAPALPGLRDRSTTLPVRAKPTRAAIFAALKQLADTTRPGDQVMVVFSGHGMQQPETVAGNEPDGKDELFLPADSGTWYAPVSGRKIDRAIIDDEIGVALDAIRAKGGNVFFVADFCHSGDSTRSGGPRAAGMNKNKPTLGGSPPDPGPAFESSKAKGQKGDYVAFFAVPADIQAGQRAAPYWERDPYPQGALTAYTLVALGDPAIRTYAELFRRVQSYISAQNIAQKSSGVPPLYLPGPDGDLSHAVLGGALIGSADSADAWSVLKPRSISFREPAKVDALDLPAGSLSGVVDGTIISLSVVEKDKERVLLYGRATDVQAWTAKLVPATHGALTEAAWTDIKDDAGARFHREARLIARIVERPIPIDLRIALPREAETTAQATALASLRRLDPKRLGGEIVTDPAAANLVFTFEGDALAVRASSHADARDYGSIALDGLPEADLLGKATQAIVRAAQYYRTRAILEDMARPAETAAADPGSALDVKFYLLRPAALKAGDPCPRRLAFREGGPIPDGAKPIESYGVTMSGTPELRRCDTIFVEVTNKGTTTVAVTPLILAPEGAIYFLPLQPEKTIRYEPGRRGAGAYRLTTDPGPEAARDDLVLIAIEEVGDDRVPLAFGQQIAQGPIVCEAANGCGGARSTRAAPIGGTAGRLAALIDGAQGAGFTRSAPTAIGRAGVRQFSWVTAIEQRPAK